MCKPVTKLALFLRAFLFFATLTKNTHTYNRIYRPPHTLCDIILIEFYYV